MVRMRARPAINLAEASDQGRTAAEIIHIGSMKHLEARLAHGCRIKARGLARCARPDFTLGVGVAPALWIGKNIQFKLTHTSVKLLDQGDMKIIKAVCLFSIRRAQLCHHRIGNLRFKTVMGTDHLDVIHPERSRYLTRTDVLRKGGSQ